MENKIINFLINSRKSTYASGMKALIKDDGKIYSIKEGDLEYRDTYFDQDRFFQGQEVLFQNKKSIWSFCYRGAAQGGVDSKEVFHVLQKFIKDYADKVRFHDNFNIEDFGWSYKCIASGDLNEFEGKEEIYKSGKLVHWMKYFGGKID